MMMSTMEAVPGCHIVRHLGLVCGNTIRGKHVGKDVMAGLKSIGGGEIRGYTEMLSDARQEAVRRMETQAEAMGANAIVNIRLSTAAVMAAGAPTSAVDYVTPIAAVSAGICTTTGAACASDADCGEEGSCYLPPGGCIEDLGTECDTDPNDDITLPECESGQYCVRIDGDGKPLTPGLLGTVQTIEPGVVPLAFSNPVFVDRDGDGYQPPGL